MKKAFCKTKKFKSSNETQNKTCQDDFSELSLISNLPLTKQQRKEKEKKLLCPNLCDVEDVTSCKIKKAGEYLLGPILGSSPVKSIVQCLGRKKNTDKYYTLKILTMTDKAEMIRDEKQGTILLHTEHSLLSFLNGQPGIIKEHGLFEDYAFELPDDDESSESNPVHKNVTDAQQKSATQRRSPRLCLVLDCIMSHPFLPASSDYVNLQHYVIGKKKLVEFDALVLFYRIVSIVKNLHDLNVVHRDLKLANLVLRKSNHQLILTNFCLGQHLVCETDKLVDQRGSPAYLSPDVLSGKPYLGKPSDMWALGVALFTMLFGLFPFYDKSQQVLFNLIKTATYTIPDHKSFAVEKDTHDLLRRLLALDPSTRWTAAQTLASLTDLITARLSPRTISFEDQVVPNVPLRSDDKKESKKEFDPKVEALFNASMEEKQSSTPLLGAEGSSLGLCRSVGGSKAISMIEGEMRPFTDKDLYIYKNLLPPEASMTVSSESSTSSLIPTTATAPSSRSSAFRVLPTPTAPSFYRFSAPQRLSLAFMQMGDSAPHVVPEAKNCGPTSDLRRNEAYSDLQSCDSRRNRIRRPKRCPTYHVAACNIGDNLGDSSQGTSSSRVQSSRLPPDHLTPLRPSSMHVCSSAMVLLPRRHRPASHNHSWQIPQQILPLDDNNNDDTNNNNNDNNNNSDSVNFNVNN